MSLIWQFIFHSDGAHWKEGSRLSQHIIIRYNDTWKIVLNTERAPSLPLFLVHTTPFGQRELITQVHHSSYWIQIRRTATSWIMTPVYVCVEVYCWSRFNPVFQHCGSFITSGEGRGENVEKTNHLSTMVLLCQVEMQPQPPQTHTQTSFNLLWPNTNLLFMLRGL